MFKVWRNNTEIVGEYASIKEAVLKTIERFWDGSCPIVQDGDGFQPFEFHVFGYPDNTPVFTLYIGKGEQCQRFDIV